MSFAEPPPECGLSDKSKAAVTLYTTFAITILSTITNPLGETAFMAFMSIFPMFRAAVGVGVYTVKIIPGCLEDVQTERLSVEIEDMLATSSRWARFKHLLLQKSHIRYYADAESTAGFFTYAVWALWHFWVPFSQIDWLARHFHSAPGGLMFARASGAAVSLVGMSVDFKARVIAALGTRFGMPVAVLLSIYTIMARLALVGVMFVEYILAAQRADIPGRKAVIASIIFFSVLSWFMTFTVIPGRDCEADDDEVEYRFLPDVNVADIHWKRARTWLTICVVGLGWAVIAALCALFMCMVALTNFITYLPAHDSNGLSISAYAKCEGIDIWSKIESLIC